MVKSDSGSSHSLSSLSPSSVVVFSPFLCAWYIHPVWTSRQCDSVPPHCQFTDGAFHIHWQPQRVKEFGEGFLQTALSFVFAMWKRKFRVLCAPPILPDLLTQTHAVAVIYESLNLKLTTGLQLLNHYRVLFITDSVHFYDSLSRWCLIWSAFTCTACWPVYLRQGERSARIILVNLRSQVACVKRVHYKV